VTIGGSESFEHRIRHAQPHEVMAAQCDLDTVKGDGDATVRTCGRVSRNGEG
jgi:hypothetical protein